MTELSEHDTASNAAIASQLDELAAGLELSGAGTHSIRAFRRAAELIRTLPGPVAPIVRDGRARELRGIGPGIEKRLRELVETGGLSELEQMRRTSSPELASVGLLYGFGAKLGSTIGAALGITTVEELRQAALDGRLREVPGVGSKTEATIVAALDREDPRPSRGLLLPRARALTEEIADALDGIPAGEARRWVDSSSRLAVVVCTDDPSDVLGRFAALPEIVTTIRPDVGITQEGIPVELHVTAPAVLGTTLVRATGPQDYVDELEPLPEAPDEESVYELLGRPFVEPELRGALGADERVSNLVELEDIRGDLHSHTTWSDGRASVLEMGKAARALGYEYLAICDHTPNVAVVPGVDADGLRRQGDEIAAANDALSPFRVLRGVECDIRADGSLDLPDDVLSELDWVQLSLHAGQRTPRPELTARVTEAMKHPAVRSLSHPTGRLIGHRPENALDLERTIEVALETGVALEVNGLPNRLDLSGDHARVAVAAGVTITCSTDAHSVRGLENMELSVRTARRGAATRANVLNTRPLAAILSR